jgi:hypothetical protein
VRATFTGQVSLTNVIEPESYVLVGEGKGGVAGFAKGEAAVRLAEPAPGQTQLSYDVTSSVGGKLAQLGARLIEGTAKGYAESFFAKLKAEVETPEAVAEAPAPAPTADPAPAAAPTSAPAPAASGGVAPLIWGSALIAAVLLFLFLQWR